MEATLIDKTHLPRGCCRLYQRQSYERESTVDLYLFSLITTFRWSELCLLGVKSGCDVVTGFASLKMGALYEDVEHFFGDIFASYGRIVARFPYTFVGISLLTCSLLGLGLLNISYEYHVERLYAPMESQALTDQARLLKLFPDKSTDDFYPRQSIISSSYGSVLITTTLPGDNLLVSPTFKEVLGLYDFIYNVTFLHEGREYHYDDVCAKREDKCVVEGGDIIEYHSQDNCYAKHHISIETYVYELEPQNDNYTDDSASAHFCEHLHTLRLKFYLKQNATNDNVLGLLWESHFLKAMHEYGGNLHMTQISYTVSDSIDVELYEHAGQDIKLLPAAIGVMSLYALGVGSGGNWVSTYMGVTHAGLIATLLSLLASYGIMGIMGIPFVDICSVTPFIVLGEYKSCNPLLE